MVNPRIQTVRDGSSSFADEALQFVRDVGVNLDEWQEHVLRASLLERDGRWAALDVGLNVARQNGKGEIIIARILVELYLVKSRLSVYSAHNFDTAKEHFDRLVDVIEDSPRLSAEVKGKKDTRSWGIYYGRGEQRVVLEDDRRFMIRTRTSGGGRGFSADLLILDEAMFLSEFFNSALRPIISARPKPQIWTAGSAVDQEIHEHGVVFARMRERAIGGDDPDLTYFEWSAGNGHPETDHPERFSAMDDQAAWAQANPSLGIRIDPAIVESERRSMSVRGFAVERLGVGDWPRTDQSASNPIDLEVWAALEDAKAAMVDPVFLAFDVSPERRGSIAACGVTADGRHLVEVVDDRPGTGWLPARLVELKGRHRPARIVCDGRSPATSLLSKLEDLNVEVEVLDAGEHAQACGQLLDGVEEGSVCHLGQPELAQAIRAASTRPLGDAWAWSRRNSSGNISPLVAATLAFSASVSSRVTRFAVGVG